MRLVYINRISLGLILHKLWLLNLLEKEGGIPKLGRQMMKVPGFEGVNVKGFLVDIFKLKGKSFHALL